MSDSFADLFANEEQKELKKLTPGQKMTATVVGMSGESIFLDVGAKSEGVLNASELLEDETGLAVEIGDTLDVYYIKTRGAELMLTTKVGSGASAEHLEEAWRSGIPVEGVVAAEIKGGFQITLSGKVRGFCPYSQMGLRRIENPEEYIGAEMTFLITRFENGGRNLVLSARALQEQEREKQVENLKSELKEGDIVEGEITSIKDFGAFFDTGVIEGLIPISEIGWSRVEKVEDYLHAGQKVKAAVKSLDWEKKRFSFSLKETLADPWEEAAGQFTPGTSVKGKIVRLTQFGAFVNLAEGVDGLVHISKLGNGRKINHPREVVETGQDFEVTVESFDAAERRISLVPADFVAQEDEVQTERSDYLQYKASKKNKSADLGSFGELLQAQMKRKGK